MTAEDHAAYESRQFGFDDKDREGFLGPGYYVVNAAGTIVAGPYAAEENCLAKIATLSGATQPDPAA